MKSVFPHVQLVAAILSWWKYTKTAQRQYA